MKTEIHPSAVIAPGAALGAGCRIGPYCVVGQHVVLGAGTCLHEHAVIDGHTELGEGCEVFPFACVGKQSQDLKYDGGTAMVRIGPGTTLREYVTVNAATAAGGCTAVGARCHILAYCHVAHECRLGDNVIMSNATQLAGHVTVADHVVFGGMAGVHQFVRIGRMAMISATAKVVQDVAPYCLADGSPAFLKGINKIGMRRNGCDAAAVKAVTAAYKILFRSNLTLEKAVAQLRAESEDVQEVDDILCFLSTGERGVARPKPVPAAPRTAIGD